MTWLNIEQGLFVIVSSLYGALLSIGSILLAGCGDGSYFLALVSCGPTFWLSMLFDKYIITGMGVVSFVISTAAWWTFVGILLVRENGGKYRGLFKYVMAIYYLMTCSLVAGYTDYIKWEKLLEALKLPIWRELTIGGVIVYILGQVFLWGCYMKASHQKRSELR